MLGLSGNPKRLLRRLRVGSGVDASHDSEA
jgi:hypothetical protein